MMNRLWLSTINSARVYLHRGINTTISVLFYRLCRIVSSYNGQDIHRAGWDCIQNISSFQIPGLCRLGRIKSALRWKVIPDHCKFWDHLCFLESWRILDRGNFWVLILSSNPETGNCVLKQLVHAGSQGCLREHGTLLTQAFTPLLAPPFPALPQDGDGLPLDSLPKQVLGVGDNGIGCRKEKLQR